VRKDVLMSCTVSRDSKLSKIRVLSIGQPPPSLKTLQIELVNDSHSVGSTSRSRSYCKTTVFHRVSYGGSKLIPNPQMTYDPVVDPQLTQTFL